MQNFEIYYFLIAKCHLLYLLFFLFLFYFCFHGFWAKARNIESPMGLYSVRLGDSQLNVWLIAIVCFRSLLAVNLRMARLM
jgi:hypothetical protein